MFFIVNWLGVPGKTEFQRSTPQSTAAGTADDENFPRDSRLGSAEYLGGGDDLQQRLVQHVTAIGIEKPTAVLVGFQIQPQGLDPPEEINMPVSDAAVAHVDKTR